MTQTFWNILFPQTFVLLVEELCEGHECQFASRVGIVRVIVSG